MIGPDSATGRLALDRETFRLVVQPGGLFQVDMDDWSQAFRPTVSADVLAPDAAQDLDRTRSRRMDGLHRRGDIDVVSCTERSTLWMKRHDLEVHRDHLIFRTEMRAGIEAPEGAVDTIRYFGDIPENGFSAHFALTKHFNDRGRTHPRTYSTGSPIGFQHVLCPEPNSYAQQLGRPFDDAQISVHADLDHRGGNFVANPGMFAFAVAAERDGVWLAMGLAVEPGNHHFSEFEYLGGERFELALNCWGARRVEHGKFVPPAVVLVPGHSAEDALARYVQVLRERELVPRPVRAEQDWWRRPIVCGWGHQSYQSDLFRIRSTRERPPDNATYTLCTQLNYQHIVETLDRQDISWGTLVIDARWFLAGGLKDIDIGRWPDLRGFIDGLHHHGRRVLLWWSPFDPEGVAERECVRYLPGAGTPVNRPGRLNKFGVPQPGKKLAADVTLPAVRARIRAQVRQALSSAAGCWNADGLKIDHVSAAPGIYGMTFPEGSTGLFGVEAAHCAMALLYEAAKDVKPEALVIGQSPNPYFADVQDMVRLGDIYSHQAASVGPEMRFRAAMARISDPSCLIDTDGWPLPSLPAWREYVRTQPSLGVPSLYYLTHLDTTGEAFTEDDYALIRESWDGL